MSGNRFKHCNKHGYYKTDSCWECDEEKRKKRNAREQEIYEQRERERLGALYVMELKQVCTRCKKDKPWWNFKIKKNGEKTDICFKCLDNNKKAETYLEHIRVENRLERLIHCAMKNNMVDLRNHLFETLEMVKANDPNMPIERAREICSIAQVIINSAKVEVEFIKIVGGKKSSFMQLTEEVEQNKISK